MADEDYPLEPLQGSTGQDPPPSIRKVARPRRCSMKGFSRIVNWSVTQRFAAAHNRANIVGHANPNPVSAVAD